MTREELQQKLDDYNSLDYSKKDGICLSCEYYRPVFNVCQITGLYSPCKCELYIHIVGQTRKITSRDRTDLLSIQLEKELDEVEEKKEVKQLELF